MAKDVEVARSERPARFWDMFDWPDRWFEGMRPWFVGEATLRIEQEMTDDSMVIRAEMPGIDPDKDVEITLSNGVLRIHAERKSEKKSRPAGRDRNFVMGRSSGRSVFRTT
jgi:HSP20 family molecular chaperone IbpA